MGPFFSIRGLSGLEDQVLELLERRCADLLGRRLGRKHHFFAGCRITSHPSGFRRNLTHLELDHVRNDKFPRATATKFFFHEVLQCTEDIRNFLLGQAALSASSLMIWALVIRLPATIVPS